jgi:polysaccharide export outer membrane protein
LRRWFTTLGLAVALMSATLAAPPPAMAVYLLDYGDQINVLVKDFPQYSYTGPIRPDGRIAIPFVGEIDVAGLTTSQVSAQMTPILARFVRDPQVTVTITMLRPRYVMVLGEVHTPGKVEINRPHPTVLDMIAASGGFTPRAVRNQVVLLHGDGAQAQHYIIDIEKMLKTADLTDDMEVQPGDRLQVPEVWYPNLTEFVAVLTPVVSIITTVALLIGFYNAAANSQSTTTK